MVAMLELLPGKIHDGFDFAVVPTLSKVQVMVFGEDGS